MLKKNRKGEILERLELHSRRLQKLKEQRAMLGIAADPSIQMEIENIEIQIESLEKELEEIKVTERGVVSDIDLKKHPYLLFLLARILREYQIRFEDESRSSARFDEACNAVMDAIFAQLPQFNKYHWDEIARGDGLAAGELLMQMPEKWKEFETSIKLISCDDEWRNVFRFCGEIGGEKSVELLISHFKTDTEDVDIIAKSLRNPVNHTYETSNRDRSKVSDKLFEMVKDEDLPAQKKVKVLDMLSDLECVFDFPQTYKENQSGNSDINQIGCEKLLHKLFRVLESFAQDALSKQDEIATAVARTMVNVSYDVQDNKIAPLLFVFYEKEKGQFIQDALLAKTNEFVSCYLDMLRASLSSGENSIVRKVILSVLSQYLSVNSRDTKELEQKLRIMLLSKNNIDIKLTFDILSRANAPDTFGILLQGSSFSERWSVITALDDWVEQQGQEGFYFGADAVEQLSQFDLLTRMISGLILKMWYLQQN